MSTEQAPACPGCHFRCQLECYQCGRGRRLLAEWRETGELPERRPGPPPGHKPPVNMRLMFGLNILSNVIRDRNEAQADGQALDAISRHEGMAARPIIAARTRLGEAQLDEALESLLEAGLVEKVDSGNLHGALQVTDAGREQHAKFEARRAKADEEFLAPLSADELEQLDGLLRKLLVPPDRR